MSFADRIYSQALQGSPYNPGVPDAVARLMVAQARHETGDFTSNLFRRYNNAFGYAYYAPSNYQTGPGSIADNGQAIAAYRSVEDSTNEVIDWLYRRVRQGRFPDLNTISTPEQYAAALKAAAYYGDTVENYLRGLKRFFLPAAIAVGSAGVLVAAGVLLYVFRDEIFG